MLKLKIVRHLSKTFSIRCVSMEGVCYEGVVTIKADELNLDLTLLGGQSFRWEKMEHSKENPTEWRGVAYNAYWILSQSNESVGYKVFPVQEAANNRVTAAREAKYFQNLLQRYFRVEFNLNAHVAGWKEAHEHFTQIAPHMKAVRVLYQEPLENILSFICSQNNNIKRISTMINWLCCKYGMKIGQFGNQQKFTFPSLEALVTQQEELESALRTAKFGYRAKFISQTVAKIVDFGGEQWFSKLRQLPYAQARLELTTLPGIGLKVADCICLMSLGHLESVPIDTHIFKIAQVAYMPQLSKVKSITPKIYDEISQHFRNIYGSYAGWAQAVMFCSSLQQFQTKFKQTDDLVLPTVTKKKRKRGKCCGVE